MKSLWRECRYALIGFLGGWFIRLWCSTFRIKAVFPTPCTRRTVLANQDAIIGGWHETLLVPIYYVGPRHMHTIISKSGDGEVIARICRNLGWNPVRGSSSRDGKMAFHEILEAGRQAHPFHVCITLDGPRGPRRKAKMGAIAAASKLGIPLIPFGFAVDRAWRAKSWDRFILPKPFARVGIVCRTLLEIPPDLDDASAKRWLVRLEEELAKAEEEARLLIERNPSTSTADRRQAA